MLYSPSAQRLSLRVPAVEVRSLGALAVINVTDNGVGGASLAAATGWPGWPTGCAAGMAP
jgi:hypothetical protein